MASSAEPHHLHPFAASAAPPPTPFGATAAPPPTPSAQPNLSSETTTPDLLSHLLRRLPPTLSLSISGRRPSSVSSTASCENPPLVSLSDVNSDALLSAATGLGFFHLAPHRIAAHLPPAAESAAASLFSLPSHRKQILFPQSFPLGYETDVDNDADTDGGESFCLDSSRSAEWVADELDMSPLGEFSREMERLGLVVVEKLACAVGFENPARDQLRPLMWISDVVDKPGRIYPYVIGLQYHIRCQKLSMWGDSGRVTVSGRVDSVLVTVGDIAQVWSNGKLKKVRGMPTPTLSNENDKLNRISMSLLITLPTEAIVRPLLSKPIENIEGEECESTSNGEEQGLFSSFSFEDYAWRVYHERVPDKDPIERYRV